MFHMAAVEAMELEDKDLIEIAEEVDPIQAERIIKDNIILELVEMAEGQETWRRLSEQ